MIVPVVFKSLGKTINHQQLLHDHPLFVRTLTSHWSHNCQKSPADSDKWETNWALPTHQKWLLLLSAYLMIVFTVQLLCNINFIHNLINKNKGLASCSGGLLSAVVVRFHPCLCGIVTILYLKGSSGDMISYTFTPKTHTHTLTHMRKLLKSSCICFYFLFSFSLPCVCFLTLNFSYLVVVFGRMLLLLMLLSVSSLSSA